MISEFDVRSAITPLRLIFWGALLWIIDFRINGFDIANDLLGSILVAIGVVRLARINVSERYNRVMGWVRLLVLISVPVVLMKMLGVASAGQPVTLLFTLFSLAQLASILAF